MLVDFKQLMYPQYDVVARLQEVIAETKAKPEFKEAVKKELREFGKEAHPDIVAHWKQLIK